MQTITVPPAHIEKIYATLNKIGNLGPNLSDGFLRAAYSAEETAAMKLIEQEAIQMGLFSRWDAIGNLALEIPGSQPGFIEIGSHLDTVPQGGNFDGAAGIVAGLEAIRAALTSGAPRRRGLRLRIWRCEESATFNSVYTGSSGAFGGLPAKFLQHQFRGITLKDAMLSQGFDPSFITEGRPTITQAEVDQILAHLELHIEQANLLEISNKEIGVVTSIRAPQRYRIILQGEFDHSGATPMGVAFRKDANLALAHIMIRLGNLADSYLAKGRDLVQTIGVINSDQDFNEKHPQVFENAMTKISGYCYFSLDIRSAQAEFLKCYSEEVLDLIKHTACEFHTKAAIDILGASTPLEAMDASLQALLAKSCTALGLSYVHMPSGAGHDAAIVAHQKRSNGEHVPVAMVFIPCRAGKSHCPEEFTSYDAIAKGSSVLAHTIIELMAK